MVLLSIVVVLLVGAVAALATGRLGDVSVTMPEAVHPTGHDVLSDGQITHGSLAAVRFDRALRGYRMDQVDAVLDRLGDELARREEQLAQLTRRVSGQPPWPADSPDAAATAAFRDVPRDPPSNDLASHDLPTDGAPAGNVPSSDLRPHDHPSDPLAADRGVMPTAPPGDRGTWTDGGAGDR